MLTIEFKAKLTKQQEELIESWLPGLRNIWNVGLRALEEFTEFAYWDKVGKSYVPCCPINWRYKSYDGVLAPYSSIVSDLSKRFITRECRDVRNVTTKEAFDRARDDSNVCFTRSEIQYVHGWRNDSGFLGYSCPIPAYYKEPKIKSPNYFGLSPLTKEENIFKWGEWFFVPKNVIDQVLKIPSKFRYGVLAALATSWQEYDKCKKKVKKGKIIRGKPKYKKSGKDEIRTLFTANAKDCVIPCDNDVLKVIALGYIKVRGLNRRWKNSDGSIPKVCVFKLIKRASGWFVQLTGEKQKSLRLRKNTVKATALDPGLNNWNTTDSGIQYENPRFYRKAEELLGRLQKEKAHKLTHNLILWLNHPSRTIEEIKIYCPTLGEEKIDQLLNAKSELEISEIVSMGTLNHLKYRAVPISNRIRKLKNRISKLHQLTANQRRNFSHKHSTWLVRSNEIVIHEDGLQSEKMRHGAKAKPNEDGTGFDKNRANAKSGLTKSLSDAGHGAFMSMIEQKAKTANRRFERFPAKYTTQECPVCNHRQEMPASIRWFKCGECGWECDRDQKAAILIMVKSFDKGIVALEQLSKPVRDVLSLRFKKDGNKWKTNIKRRLADL